MQGLCAVERVTTHMGAISQKWSNLDLSSFFSFRNIEVRNELLLRSTYWAWNWLWAYTRAVWENITIIESLGKIGEDESKFGSTIGGISLKIKAFEESFKSVW